MDEFAQSLLEKVRKYQASGDQKFRTPGTSQQEAETLLAAIQQTNLFDPGLFDLSVTQYDDGMAVRVSWIGLKNKTPLYFQDGPPDRRFAYRVKAGPFGCDAFVSDELAAALGRSE